MGLFRKIKQKIRDGALREFAQEAKWLWQYIRRYRAAVLIHILLGVLGILMSLASSVASKYLIDAVTGFHAGRIGSAAALMVGMMLGNIAMRSISSRVGAVLNIRIHNEMQAEVFERILSTDWESVEQYRSGDLLNRLNSDTNAVSGSVTGFIPSFVSSIVQFVGAFCIILFYDPTMAVIALLGVPVSVICSRVMVGRMRRYNKQMKAIHSDVVSFQEDSFQNLTSIKSFGITAQFSRKMEQLQRQYKDAYLDYNRFSVYTAAFMSVVSMVVSAGCFGWGVYRLWAGAISYGSLTMFLQLASTLGGAFSSIVGLVPSAISVSTSAGRIMNVVQLPAETCGEAEGLGQERDVTVCLTGVNFAYQTGERVLREIDLTAAPGDLVAISGPSGGGKTTVLRLLLGLVTPQQGSVELIGGSGRHYPVSAATRSVFAYVPQGNSIFTGTIAENLRLTKPEATQDELEEVLKLACAFDFVKELPGGIDYRVGGRGKGLSEGQAQRIAVARALLCRAPVLLLDEATSALDEETESLMLQNLMGSGVVRTCIVVTHRPGTRKFCTSSYAIRDGQLQRLTQGGS